MTYHLHTVDSPRLDSIISRHFDGYTVLQARGMWRGEAEQAVVIEIADTTFPAVELLAHDLAFELQQWEVMIEAYPSEMRIVSGTPAFTAHALGTPEVDTQWPTNDPADPSRY